MSVIYCVILKMDKEHLLSYIIAKLKKLRVTILGPSASESFQKLFSSGWPPLVISKDLIEP